MDSSSTEIACCSVMTSDCTPLMHKSPSYWGLEFRAIFRAEQSPRQNEWRSGIRGWINWWLQQQQVRQTTITHPLHLLIHKRIPRWIQWRCKSHHNPISQSPTVTSQPPPPPYSHTLQICTRKGLQTFKDDDDDYSHKQGRRSRMNEWMWTRTHLLAGTIIRQYNHPNSHTQPNFSLTCSERLCWVLIFCSDFWWWQESFSSCCC